MPVAADLQPLLDLRAEARDPEGRFDPEVLRDGYRAICTAGRDAAAEVANVDDSTIPGPDSDLPIRTYRAGGLGERPPVVLYLHGGGWTLGDLDGYDEQCRAVAATVGAVVVALEYRLAPEHPFPAAVEDAWAALCWLADHADDLDVDADRLVVAGDSAGGNLTAVLSLLARDRGGPVIAHQFMVYPGIDFDHESGRWPSLEENAEGLFLELRTMRWFAANYSGGRDLREEWMACPIRADDHTDVAPATITIADFDPLRDEGLGYAEVLAAAGVPVEVLRHAEQVHGYWIVAPLVPSSGAARAADLESLRATIAALPAA